MFPSKSFLIGEYLALTGGPSILVTHEPQFEKSSDPYSGAGGFGASTAEFLFEHYENQTPDEILKLYLSHPMHGNHIPSGFDLVAQVYGKPCVIRNTTQLQISEFKIQGAPLMLFQASHLPNRKTKTFEHLKKVSLNPMWVTEVTKLVEEFIRAFDKKEWATAGALMNQFSDCLRLENWVSPQVQKERLELLAIPGVLGVKGAGAMQTDALWVLTDPTDKTAQNRVAEAAKRLGLRILPL